MKKFSLPILTLVSGVALSVQAANITFVSFHPADETPSANAANAGFTNAPDAGYTAVLRAAGHNVTRYVTTSTPDVATLNAADLVILSRSVPSGHYQNEPSPTEWNGITAPMIVLNGYLTRANRLGLTTGDSMSDVNTVDLRLRANAPQHPIFKDIPLTNNVMVNPFLTRMTYTNPATGTTTLQLGVSVNTSAFLPAGSVIAVINAGTAANSMMIGELPSGAVSSSGGASTLGAKRLVFFTGSRESGITSEGAGIMDLLPDGQKMLLNAVDYLLDKTAPPLAAISPTGTYTNLFPGDWFNISGTSSGADPRTNQWYLNGQPIPGATTASYQVTNFTTAAVGDYHLVVANPYGSVTSAVVRLEAGVLPPLNITNGLIAYWPMDQVMGTKTPDVVSGYDMSLVNMGSTNIMPGQWGNAFQFDATWGSYMERFNQPGEDLPVYQHTNFTVSLWVAGQNQVDKRVFSEGSTTNGSPLFNIGTHSASATANPPNDGRADIYIRNDNGATSGDHRWSSKLVFDGFWRNMVYVQRDIGNGMMKAQLYIDGELDAVQITPVRPLTPNTTSIGAIRRADPSALFTGMIDEVACWDRALSPAEIAVLQTTSITNPPSRVQPLAITKFKADLPALSYGTSTTLRWEVSKDASSVTITPIGDVTAQTSVGVGSRTITLLEPTTYVLTIKRGADSLSATTHVGVVEGVAPAWALLDNFDQYTPGNLFSYGYWNDVSGASVDVVNVAGNPAARPKNVAFLNLRALSVQENQARTLFFRIMPGTNGTAGVTNIIGLTDKNQRGFGDAWQNMGPVVYAASLTNTPVMIETNAWYLGARNGDSQPGAEASSDIVYSAFPMQADVAYDVWIDITNAPMTELAADMFSVYMQKPGDATRTLIIQDYISDRDFWYMEPVLGGMNAVLDKLVLLSNTGANTALYDDFYLSTGGYNATVPRAYGYTGPQRDVTVKAVWVGNQLSIQFTGGVLQQATSPTGEWTDVPGNPTTPYLVTPTGSSMFFRTR